MTYDMLEEKVRTLVNDTQEGYSFAQGTIFGFLVDSVRHLRNINPSEKYDEHGLLDEDIPTPGVEVEVRIDPRHEEAVVKYAAHLVYQLDMTDSVNLQISETLRTRAEALMQL
jgi:hypothetical protein